MVLSFPILCCFIFLEEPEQRAESREPESREQRAESKIESQKAHNNAI